ncbi:unnamed protein product [Dicrocoelium dendriticum]|nr:unnamed protein product [Dicrocoelium dendriticum]
MYVSVLLNFHAASSAFPREHIRFLHSWAIVSSVVSRCECDVECRYEREFLLHTLPGARCNQKFGNSDSGILLSPGYPVGYGENEFCNYAVKVISDDQIGLFFMEANLNEDYQESENYILLFDGPDCMSPVMGKVVNDHFRLYYTTGNQLTLLFISGRQSQGHRFQATYFAGKWFNFLLLCTEKLIFFTIPTCD